jgi:outer membrane protein TolC
MNKTRFVRPLAFLCMGFSLYDTALFAQAPTPIGAPSGGSAEANAPAQITFAPQAGETAYQGSVPQGTASTTPIALTLGEAIRRGLKANLGLLTSEQSSRETRAERYRALAGLLPTVNGQVSDTEQQLNLQALGFVATVPPNLGFQIPKIVGPYSYQVAQASANVPLFDYTAINNYRSSRENLKASTLSIRNARDLVVQAVGDAYLQIIADAARVVATRAEIDADNAVYVNAERRHQAGVAIGIDVLRSQVQLKQRQQALVAEINQFAKDKLTLARVIGLPIGQDFTVADPSLSVPLEAISLQDALAKAYEHRPDFQAAKAQLAAAEFSLRAARAERYPTLQASGYYGAEGLGLFNNSHGVFQATGSLQFNIFDNGRIKADILQSDAELRNRRNDLENLRGQIDYDVRSCRPQQCRPCQSNAEASSRPVRGRRN